MNFIKLVKKEKELAKNSQAQILTETCETDTQPVQDEERNSPEHWDFQWKCIGTMVDTNQQRYKLATPNIPECHFHQSDFNIYYFPDVIDENTEQKILNSLEDSKWKVRTFCFYMSFILMNN